jgi:DNA-binding winged helix-turn-helix (wHTH) protein/Tol biopolymer transport system component
MPISFGPFAFDRQSRLLSRQGTEIALPPRVLGVLELLIERQGQVVPRQDLLDRVWKDAFVTDTSLAEAVSVLRQALGDDPQAPRYIQTVHRRGYRFLPPITEQPAGPDRGQTGAGPGSDPAAGAAAQRSQYLPWGVAAICLLLAGAAMLKMTLQPAPETPHVARFEVDPPAGSAIDRRAPALAVSADGRSIAWSGCEAATGACSLFVRQIDRLEPERLAGTDGAAAPFFSPDGRWLGFFADGKLKKIRVSGGAPVALADAPSPGGGSWSQDGRIVFSGLPAGGLAITSDQGGDVTTIAAPRFDNGELRDLWPSWLPGDRAILFTIATSPVGGAPGLLAVLRLPSHEPRVLRTGVTRAAPAGSNYLLVAGASDLQAATFDDRTLTLTGSSDPVLDALATAAGTPQFAAGGGTLIALRSAAGPRTIAWNTDPEHPFENASRLAQLTLAPDGRHAAGVIADLTSSDIWIVDFESGALTRRTFGGVNASPVWAPDGSLVYATRSIDGPFRLSSTSAGTTTEPHAHLLPAAVAADGRIAALDTTSDGRTRLVLLAPGSPPKPVADGPFDETSASFSPDAQWLAFDSDASGRREVFVASTGGPSHAPPLSIGAGERPSWTEDGRAIDFHDGPRLVRVAFTPDPTPHAGARKIVFNRPDARVIAVAGDGRLLVERQPATESGPVLILEWLSELRRRLPLPVTTTR